jgi:hypothetical protein
MRDVLSFFYGGLKTFRKKHPRTPNSIFLKALKKVNISGNLSKNLKQLERLIMKHKNDQVKFKGYGGMKRVVKRVTGRSVVKPRVRSPSWSVTYGNYNSNSSSNSNSLTRAMSKSRIS